MVIVCAAARAGAGAIRLTPSAKIVANLIVHAPNVSDRMHLRERSSNESLRLSRKPSAFARSRTITKSRRAFASTRFRASPRDDLSASVTKNEKGSRAVGSGEALAAVSKGLGIARKLLYEWRWAWRRHGAAVLNRRRGTKKGLRRKMATSDPAGAALASSAPSAEGTSASVAGVGRAKDGR